MSGIVRRARLVFGVTAWSRPSTRGGFSGIGLFAAAMLERLRLVM
jgi:hypothetical protein